jgi:hypothetical protein
LRQALPQIAPALSCRAEAGLQWNSTNRAARGRREGRNRHARAGQRRLRSGIGTIVS